MMDQNLQNIFIRQLQRSNEDQKILTFQQVFKSKEFSIY